MIGAHVISVLGWIALGVLTAYAVGGLLRLLFGQCGGAR